MEAFIGAFHKAQRMNIMSFIKEKLKKEGYNLQENALPLHV